MHFVGALQQRDHYSPDHSVFNNGVNHLNRVGILNQYQQNRVGIPQYPNQQIPQFGNHQYPAQQVTQFGIQPHAARPFIPPPLQHTAPAQTLCGSPKFAHTAPVEPVCGSPQFARTAPAQPVFGSPAEVGNGRPINTAIQYNGNTHVMGNRQIPGLGSPHQFNRGIGNPQGSPFIPQYDHRAAQNFRAIVQNQYGSPIQSPRVQSAVPPHNIPLQVANNLQGNHGYQVSHGYNLPSNHSYPGVAAVRNNLPQQQLYRTMIHQNLSPAHSPAPSRLPSPFILPLADDYYQEPPTRPLYYDPPSNLMKYAPTAKGLPFSSQDLRPEVLAVYIPGVGMQLLVKKQVCMPI
eukprot:sb/3466297/